MPSYSTRVAAGALIVLAAVVSSPPLRAQSKRAMTLVDLVNIPRVLDPQATANDTSMLPSP